MDTHQIKNKESSFKDSSISAEISQNLNKNITYNKDNNNDDIDKSTLNLFKGIVKINRIKSLNENKNQIIKTCSLQNKQKFSNFVDNIYNNEDHLNNKLKINPINNLEYITPKNDKISLKMFNSIKLTSNSGANSFSKKKYIKDGTFSHKNGNASNKNLHKFKKNYPFFFKPKEKYKIPSKTPYLDRKARKSAYEINHFNFQNNKDVIFSKLHNKNIKQNSNKSLNEEIIFIKEKNNNKINEEEKEGNVLNSNKKFEDSNRAEINNNINVNKNEATKLDFNNNTKNKQILSQKNSKGKRNTNNIIINVLTKPFFCCLNS